MALTLGTNCPINAAMDHEQNWEAIEAAARELGVSEEAIRKWKTRGSVPGKWHLAIIAKSEGRVPAAALHESAA